MIGSARCDGRALRPRRLVKDYQQAKIGAVALIRALAGFGGAVATGYFIFASKDEELRVRLVELAISLLRADPKDGVTPTRGWAIDVIEKTQE
jgi:hypothetical protein